MTIRWTALRLMTVMVALLALLTACDSGEQQGATRATTDPHGSGQSTTTAGANQPVASSNISPSCMDPAAVVAGDLRVSPTTLGYGQQVLQVPGNAPLKPLALPAQGANGLAPREIPGWFYPAGDSPPDLLITVCNTSTTKAHTIESVSVKLSAFTPYGGSLNTWNPCDGAYTRPAGFIALDCGEGAAIYDEYVRATFDSSAQVGAVVPAPLADPTAFGNFGPLPAALAPGQSMLIAVFVKAPATAGIYTFAAGILADNAPMPFTAGQSVLLAPIAHRWTGKACLSPIMQTGIPANSPAGTYYICPES